MELADKASFRDAMAHVGAAVNIITTDGPAGRAGFTASAVCSVTDTPPSATSHCFSLKSCDRVFQVVGTQLIFASRLAASDCAMLISSPSYWPSGRR